MEFGAAIISTVVVALLGFWCSRVHRRELKTGKTPGDFIPLSLCFCLVFAFCAYAEVFGPFAHTVGMIVMGQFTGLGVAYFVFALAALLTRARRPAPPPKHFD